jgi:8-oxo-dGTP pyrophosphatase MutT (NUDIX family)
MQQKITAAGGLVTNDRQELLMIFRRGKWDLPKGKLDEGETIEACAVREVEEETGLQSLELGEKIGITYHTYQENNTTILKETHWFAMHAGGNQQLVPQAEEDITRIDWVNTADLPEKLEHTYDNIIEIIEKGNFIKNKI